jgi:hypothetical protein
MSVTEHNTESAVSNTMSQDTSSSDASSEPAINQQRITVYVSDRIMPYVHKRMSLKSSTDTQLIKQLFERIVPATIQQHIFKRFSKDDIINHIFKLGVIESAMSIVPGCGEEWKKTYPEGFVESDDDLNLYLQYVVIRYIIYGLSVLDISSEAPTSLDVLCHEAYASAAAVIYKPFSMKKDSPERTQAALATAVITRPIYEDMFEHICPALNLSRGYANNVHLLYAVPNSFFGNSILCKEQAKVMGA